MKTSKAVLMIIIYTTLVIVFLPLFMITRFLDVMTAGHYSDAINEIWGGRRNAGK